MNKLHILQKLDPDDLLKNDIEILDKVTEELLINIADSVINGNVDIPQVIIQNFNNAYSFLDQQFALSSDSNRRIYYYGVWKTLFEILRRSYEFHQKVHDYDAIVKQYKNVPVLIRLLHKLQFCNHSELAKSLQIKANTLSNLIRRIYKYQFISATNVGRHKIYHLTGNGHDLYNYMERYS